MFREPRSDFPEIPASSCFEGFLTFIRGSWSLFGRRRRREPKSLKRASDPCTDLGDSPAVNFRVFASHFRVMSVMASGQREGGMSLGTATSDFWCIYSRLKAGGF